MITVHHLETSQSFRIVWLLEELGNIDYTLKLYQRQKDNQAPPEYKELSPLGTAPVITIDDNNDEDGGLVLCESNAIIDYILDKSLSSSKGNNNKSLVLRPPPSNSSHTTTTKNNDDNINSTTISRTDYLFWYHASQGTLQSDLSQDSLMRIIPTRLPFILSWFIKIICNLVLQKRISPRIENYMKLAEEHFSTSTTNAAGSGSSTTNTYFAGTELTAADITSIYPIHATFCRYPNLEEKFPLCKEWLERVMNRPAFVRAIEKTGGNKQVSLPL